eukprot:jgi/Tetstr1/447905/TSEL_035213.t1
MLARFEEVRVEFTPSTAWAVAYADHVARCYGGDSNHAAHEWAAHGLSDVCHDMKSALSKLAIGIRTSLHGSKAPTGEEFFSAMASRYAEPNNKAPNAAGDVERGPGPEDGDALARRGARVDFHIKSYSVRLKGGDRKTILDDVRGVARSGEVLSIMGPSGAGKSTLLDTLSGVRPQTGSLVDANIQLDGTAAGRKQLSATCYVRQVDVLVSSATVRESILTAALLKLPRSMRKQDKLARVDAIIDELGLTECQHTMVGDEAVGLKGISGGQKRRVSIGVELVKNPSVIFLDEPTTGLDSEIALDIATSLKTLASAGRTVVLTIHQPNSDITETFDRFMLMASGKVCYHGPFSESMQVFADAGFACPTYKNPTDHYMRIVSNEDHAAAVVSCYSKSSQFLELDGLAASSHAPSESGLVPVSRSRSDAPPLWLQFGVIITRFFRSMMRHPIAFVAELTQYWFMALFVALMYLQITDVFPDALYDRAASQWFVLVVLGFKVLNRETADSTYPVWLFYLAKVLSVVPFELFFGITSSAIMYFAIGYQADFVKFVVFTIALYLVLMVSQGYGLMAAALTGDPNGALIVVSLVLIVLLSFTGFLTTNVPVYFSWVKHVSFLNFAASAMWVTELEGLTMTTEGGGEVSGDDMLHDPEYSRMWNGASPAANIGYLVANLAVLHVIALIAITIRKARNAL